MYLDFTINQANNHAVKTLDKIRGVALMGIMTDEYSTVSENRSITVDLYSLLENVNEASSRMRSMAPGIATFRSVGGNGIQGVQGIMGLEGCQGIQGTKGADALCDDKKLAEVVQLVSKQVLESIDPYSIIPIGTIIGFAGVDIPKSDKFEYKLCDGGKLIRSKYSELYSIIGVTYGDENGMIILPDLRDKLAKVNFIIRVK